MSSDVVLFKALGNETNNKIVKALLTGERCACELPGIIGRTQPNTSMHLKKLTQAGILKHRREGRSIIYSIQDNRIHKIFKALGLDRKHAHKKLWNTRSQSCSRKGRTNE
ncbi:MAG: ArsR/SmtB family transcription factor [Candidatus Woesearchaeota archaeon]